MLLAYNRIMKFWIFIKRVFLFTLIALNCCGPFQNRCKPRNGPLFHRPYEFDYVTWTLDAVALKNRGERSGVSLPFIRGCPAACRPGVFRSAGQVRRRVGDQQIYANPAIANPDEAAQQRSSDIKNCKQALMNWLRSLKKSCKARSPKPSPKRGSTWEGKPFRCTIPYHPPAQSVDHLPA